jgi:inner membrane transporter RhtA
MACVGVVLLAGVELGADPVGFGFALLSAVLWAGYILLGKRVADAGQGLDSLAVGMAIGAAVSAPFVLIPQARIDSSVFLDSRTWLLGAAIGLLATAIPYALDQVALKIVGRATFALLLALLPATATVIGITVLLQTPSIAELLGIGLVVLALLLGARPGGAPTVGAPSPPPA